MKNEHMARILAIEDSAGWFHDLTATPPLEFRRLRAELRMSFQMINMLKNSLDEASRRFWVV